MLLAYAKLALHHELLQSNVPDDPYLGRELGRYFPEGGHRAIPGCGRAPSAAARHHRHAACQFHGQSRRPFAAGAHRRSDRRLGGKHCRRLCRRARQLRDDRAQWRDRRARQQDLRQAAARALSGGAGSAARPAGLVPAQRRSHAGARVHCRALSRRHCSSGGRPRRRAAGSGRCRAQGARGRAAEGRRAARACAPSRHVAGAGRRARYRDGRRPRGPELSPRSRPPISPPKRSSVSTRSSAPPAAS